MKKRYLTGYLSFILACLMLVSALNLPVFASQIKDPAASDGFDEMCGMHKFELADPKPSHKATEATCTKGETYFYSCIYCGAKGTETFEYGDKIPHSYAYMTLGEQFRTENYSASNLEFYYSCVCGVKGTKTFTVKSEDVLFMNYFEQYEGLSGDELKLMLNSAFYTYPSTTTPVTVNGNTYLKMDIGLVIPEGSIYDVPYFAYANYTRFTALEIVSYNASTKKLTLSDGQTYSVSGTATSDGYYGTFNYGGTTWTLSTGAYAAAVKFGDGNNVDRSMNIHLPEFSYAELDTVYVETSYYIEPNSNGIIEIDITSYLADGVEKTFLHLAQINLATGAFNRGGTLTIGQWNKVGIFMDLVNGTADFYLNGTPVKSGYNLGVKKIEFSKIAIAKIYKSTPSSFAGALYLDNVSVYETQHAMSAWVETKAPTCTASGTERRECMDEGCDYYETREVAKLGHKITQYNAQTPVCGGIGWDAYEACDRCDYTTYVEISGGEHSFGSWTKVSNATCTEDGEARRYCKTCDHYETRVMTSTGHKIVSHAAQAPTCTENGWYAYEACSKCDYTTRVDIPALGHTMSAWNETKAPTCTEFGTERRECTVEGCDYYETNEIAKLGHNIIQYSAQEPVCGGIGWDAYEACDRCDYTTYVEIPGSEHSFGTWTKVSSATCTEDGEARRYCKNCDHYETRVLTASGHKIVSHAAQAATCTEIGWYAYEACSKCDYTTYVEIPALTHAWGDWICMTDGTEGHYRVCANDATHKETGDHVFDGVACTACPAFKLVGANMTLGNELAMNFYVSKNSIDVNKTYYFKVTKTYADGREAEVRYFAQSEWKTLGSNYYVEFNGVAAKEMNDTIYVQVFYADDTPASTLWVDSVAEYAVRIMENQNAKTKTMLVDMLNYGAAAQLHFEYDVDNLANSRLTDAQKAYATESVVMADHRVKGNNYYGSNLDLGNKIVLGLYFKNVDETMYAIVSYTNHYGVAQSVRVEGSDFLKSGSLYRIPMESLVIADAKQTVTCTVYTADGVEVGSCVDSVESYIARMSETGALYETIMKFADSAYKNFHS